MAAGLVLAAALACPWSRASADALRTRLVVEEGSGGAATARVVARRFRQAVRATWGVSLVGDGAVADAELKVRVVRLRRRVRRFRLEVVFSSLGDASVRAAASVVMRRRRPSRIVAARLLRKLVRRFRRELARARRRWRPGTERGNGEPADEAAGEEGGAGDEQRGEEPEEVSEEVSSESGAEDFSSDWVEEEPEFAEVPDEEAKGDIERAWEVSIATEHYRYLEDPPALSMAVPPGALGADEPTPGRDSVEFMLEARLTAENAEGRARFSARRDFSMPERDRATFTEAYGEFRQGPVMVRGGFLIESWGTGTLWSPSDILNPIDLRDPLDPEKLGLWALRVGLLFGDLSISAYYLPVPAAHLLPPVAGIALDGTVQSPSRWVRGRLVAADADVMPRFVSGGAQLREPSLENTQAAARLAWSGKKTDLAVSYAYMFDPFSTPAATVLAAGPAPTLRIDFYRDRLHVVTAEMEGVVGRWRFEADAAAVFPMREKLSAASVAMGPDPEDPVPYLAAVVGGDWQSAQFGGDHSVHLYLDLVFVFGLDGDLPDDPIGKLRFPFRRTAMFRFEYDAGRDLRFGVDAVSALDGFDLLVRPKVRYRIADLIEVRAYGAWLTGGDDGFFGTFDDNSRAGVELKASY